MYFKIPKIRNPKYLEYIRSLSCVIQMDGEYCNGAPVDAHHLTCTSDGVMGDKAGDDKALPLCRLHHNTLHRIGEKTFWERWGIDAVKLTKELWGGFMSSESKV